MPSASRSPREVAAARSLTRRRLGVGVCTLVAAWVSYAIYSETAAGHSADQTVAALQRQNAALRTEIDQRNRQVSGAQTTSWLVEEARRLGYVLSGERVYVPVPTQGRLPIDGGIDIAGLPGPGPAPPATAAPSAAPAPASTSTGAATPAPTLRTIGVPVPGSSPAPASPSPSPSPPPPPPH